MTDRASRLARRGDAVCRATNVTYRLDTEAARTFLSQHVALP